jgi:oligopeptide/dipeptide ABC transporter ATP-binding protein
MSSGPQRPERRKRRPLLEVDRLSKLFAVPTGLGRRQRFVRVVDNTSYFVRHGETLGLVGRTGSGKTTLAQATVRLTEPTYGRIKLDERDITQLTQKALRPLRRNLQIVFQDPGASLDPRLTAREIIGEPIRIHRTLTSQAEIRDRVTELGARLGLDSDALARRPGGLSAGEKQRVALARALSIEPRVLLLDDPLTHQDARTRADVLAHLAEAQEEHHNALLLIGHDLTVVASLSHRMAVMYFGRIVEVAPTRQLMTEPQHPYTRTLVAAQSKLSPAKRQLHVMLEGEHPDPFAPPDGCAFHGRCPRAERGRCDREIPDLAPVDAGGAHRVACFHPGSS